MEFFSLDKLIDILGLADDSKFEIVLKGGIHILLILVCAWFLYRLAKKSLRLFRARIIDGEDKEEEKRLETLARVFRYVTNVAIFTTAGMLILTELGVSIAPILATAGVLGLAIGFGAQSLVKDYFSGFFILLENQIRKDDVIEVCGKSGTVEDMTLRYVRLRDYQGNVHFIPNGQINFVTNMTRDFSYAAMDIGIAYREDIEEAIAVIRQVAAQLRADTELQDSISADVDIAGVNEWGASAVNIRLRFKVLPGEQWKVKRAFLQRLKLAFDAHHIEIPFPHMTIYAGQLKDGSAAPFQMMQTTTQPSQVRI